MPAILGSIRKTEVNRRSPPPLPHHPRRHPRVQTFHCFLGKRRRNYLRQNRRRRVSSQVCLAKLGTSGLPSRGRNILGERSRCKTSKEKSLYPGPLQQREIGRTDQRRLVPTSRRIVYLAEKSTSIQTKRTSTRMGIQTNYT